MQQLEAPRQTPLPLLVSVAWYLRQRDTRRAIACIDQAFASRAMEGLDAGSRRRLEARKHLIHAEADWLFARFDAANARAAQALSLFGAIGDFAGCADAHWLSASIASDQGEPERRDAELDLAVDCARNAGDALRLDMARAAQASWAAIRNAPDAERHWLPRFSPDVERASPVLQVRLSAFFALCESGQGDYARAVSLFVRSYEAALETGQIDRAIIAATNLSECFRSLNDFESALEWADIGLDIARRKRWPLSMGLALVAAGKALHAMRRLESAYELMTEAAQVFVQLPKSRGYTTALQSIGELQIDRGDHAAALSTFELLERRTRELSEPRLLLRAKYGQAAALCRLGRYEEALHAAEMALALAREHDNPHLQVESLKVLAEIHAEHEAPPPPGMTTTGTALHYLNRALEISSRIDGHVVPVSLFQAIAREYARAGDFDNAYAASLRAVAAFERISSDEVMNRAIATQVRHRTESARAEAERHRQLAEAEAWRAEALQRMNATLERLGVIGQEITAQLDVVTICLSLHRYVSDMLDARHFSVYLLSENAADLHCVFDAEEGRPPPETAGPADEDSAANSARCARERREIFVESGAESEGGIAGSGSGPGGSAMFMPLIADDRLLGVMSVRSPSARAYADRERLFFRTLCAYAAIALDNASAYRQLEEAMERLQVAQRRLVFREKMAALGMLTAGVAHEINNPANFSHAGAQTLEVELSRLRRFLLDLAGDGTDQEVVAALEGRIDALTDRVKVILDGTSRIGELVRDLRVFSRLDEAERMAVPVADILMSTINLVRMQYDQGVEFRCALDANPILECRPAQLRRVFMNIAVNACQAIEAKRKTAEHPSIGLLEIRGRLDGGHFVLEFEDNGCGMPQHVLERIFEPFFTTKEVGEGTGLGLSISFGIVEIHQGVIQARSTEGVGSCFTVRLPFGPRQG
ncbi:MAG TPA: ATP-binding protein [Paucimonas sp.]|nr:ATP-binding protein [Paucimonas sp.]